MASGTAPPDITFGDDEGEVRPRGAAALESGKPSDRGLLFPGLIAGAAAGAIVGLLDVGRSFAGPGSVVTGGAAPEIVGIYAACFAPCGIVAALIARRFAWPQRALSLLIKLGAAFFLLAAYLNLHHLPSFTSGVSVFTDVVLLIAFFVLFRRRYFGPGMDDIAVGKWFTLGVLATAAAFGLKFAFPGQDEGDAPAASAAAEGRPNVLIYMVDTLRADHLSAYGYERPTSPEVDEFAKDAVLFESCRAPSSWTKPSVASLFTSLYPSTHSCIEPPHVLVPEAETLAEVFRAAGWKTAAFSDNPFISPEFGFKQGFDEFDYVRPSVFINGTMLGKCLFMTGIVSLAGKPLGVGDHNDRGVRVLQSGDPEAAAGEPGADGGVLGFIDRSGDQPWFAYVHAMEPHLPYDPPPAMAQAFGFPSGEAYRKPPVYGGILPFRKAPDPPPALRERLIAQYDGEIRDVSMAFGELLAALRSRGKLDNTIVVFVADHGEEFHERGGWTHGHSLNRELVQVPLIVRLPDSLGEAAAAGRGRRIRGHASLMDLFPTLEEACALTYRPRMKSGHSGWSLMPYLAGVDGASAEDVVGSGRALLGEITMGPVSVRSILDGRFLYVQAKQPLEEHEALYDVTTDPGETRPRPLGDHIPKIAELEAKLDGAFEAFRDIALSGASRDIDAETRDKLSRIGYFGGDK